MADFVDAEAEESTESSEEEQEVPHDGKKRKRTKASGEWEEGTEQDIHPSGKKKTKKAKTMDESDEEEEDDEDRLRQELKDLINDDSTESEAEDSDDAGSIKKRKKSKNSDFDDRLEDDDYDLLEENLGIAVERKKRFKRLRRIEDGESDEEGELADERDVIANELFDDSTDDHERRSVTSQRPEPEIITDETSEADLSDADDFIVDEDGRPVAEKRRKKRPVFDDAALQEAQDIFGIDFDYDEFNKYGEEEADEDDDEDDEYVDDDVDGERVRLPKNIRKKKGTKKTIFEIYEPSELKRGHFTDLDNEIRNTDVPERMQLRSVPITPVPEGSDELDLEAEWVYKHAFCRPTISVQDAHLNDEAKERARKGPQTVGKIKKALDFMRNQNFEVPFISFYRKEYVNPELNINDLWKIYKYDAKWCELRQRKDNLLLLFEKMRSYQLDEIMKNPDAPLPESMRVIKEEDIDRLKSVETSEELNDVHHHFMLYYSHEIPKMQAEVRLREKEAKLAVRVEKRQQEIAEATEKGEEMPYQYGMDIEMDDEDNENEETLKQASRVGPYSICRKAGLGSFAKKFGLQPEQFAENLRDNYQRHEVEQDPIEPSIVALDYLCPKFPSSEEVIKAVKLMVAVQLAREPLVRKSIREIYMERAKISIVPTKNGIKEIDENHPIYSMKFLKDKPVSELVGDQFLKLSIAENDKLITISFSDVVEGAISGNYMDEMKQLYHRDEFSKNVQDWNDLRDGMIGIAYERMLIPDMKKELRSNLMAESKEFILRSCCRKMYNWIKIAPYSCNFGEEDDLANEEDEWETEEDEGRKKKVEGRENDEDWKTNKGIRVMGIAYVPDYSQAAFACIVSPDGECTDYLRLPHLLKRKNGPREDDKPLKEADLLAITKLLSTKKPHVIVLGGESREATWLADDIRECIANLVAEEQFPSIKVEICENELAKIYASGNRGTEEFRDYPILLRQAISLARRMQDPLVEFSRLCSLDDEILCIKYHPYQDQVPKEELLENIHLEFVNRVNEVGVDLNAALRHQNSLNLVQFICGLGPRKAQALIKLLKQTNKRIENRTQLVTVCHMGPKVFINCAGFVKIDTASLGDSTETYVEVLDGTRVHPETYEWARKMAIDALEYDDEEETNRAGAVEEIFEAPDRLKELDLDAFAEELERQGFGNKRVTLYDIRAELNSRYKDLRAPYESPSAEKLFDILTKETPETFYLGKLILATVSALQRRKPEGEQLDQANPVRNDDTGLWQCPFCLKNDFPELSEVWGHFDSGTCPGKPMGVRLRLDNGISGYIHVRNLSDKHVDNPEDRVRPGQVIHCRIIKIEVDRFSVECTSKSSDLADKNNEWKPQRDAYYDNEAEEKILRTEEELRQIKHRQAYVKRVIVHTAFHNINYAEAAKMMETMKQGEAIVRPSSKGNDRLTVTWKVTDDVLHHIDVREDGKKFVFSLGKRLFIGNEEYEDLDEIIARHVNPMAAYASELLECHYYKRNIDGLEEKADQVAKEEKRENPNRIPCILSASKKYPGKFLLSYLPRERCIHEYISVTPDGVRFRGRTFARVGELFSWFRKHFRDPRPVVTPKTTFYTPSGFDEGVDHAAADDDDDDDLNHHTLSMTASETPGLFAPHTPGKNAGARYSNPYPMTPCTPSSTFHGSQGTFVGSQKTPNYGQTTLGNGQGGFAYPGAPARVGFQQKSRSNHGQDYTDWKRASGGGTGYENTRGRGRGRGSRGDRGGRGCGRGRGGQNTSYNSSRGSSYSNTSNSSSRGSLYANASNNSCMGDSTPLWDEADSWDEPSQPTQTSSSMNNRSGSRGNSNASSTPMGKDAPLWDESENWDEPETTTTQNSLSSVRTNDNLTKSPLWDESESWDDTDSAGPQSKLPAARNNLGTSRNAPLSNSGSASVMSGNRSPLWDESESWDDTEPSAPNDKPPNAKNTSLVVSRNAPLSNSGPSSVTSIGSRTPLYDASESWDDESESPAPQSKSISAQNSSGNFPPANYGAPKAPPMLNRTPVYAPIGRCNKPYRSTPRNGPPSARNSYGQPSHNIPRNRAEPPSVASIGNRTPLYDASESWDDEPESPAPQSQSLSTPSGSFPSANSGPSKAQPMSHRPPSGRNSYGQPSHNTPRTRAQPSSVAPIGNRTPLYDASESWDDEPESPTLQNQSQSAKYSSGNFPPANSGSSNVSSIASRTPVYAPMGSFNKPDRSAPRNATASGRNSYGQTSRDTSRSRVEPPSVAPIGSRTPLYDASESWDDEAESPTQQNQSQPAKNLSGNFPPANSGSSSIPPIASRAPVYAPMGSFNKPDRSAPRNATASGRNSYGQTSLDTSRSRVEPPSVAPIGSRTPLYDASESWDDEPESPTPQNQSQPAKYSSGNFPPANSGSSNVSSSASRTPVYAPMGSFNKPDRSAPRNAIASGRNSYGQTSRDTSRSRVEPPSVAPIGSRTPLYDASESWDDEPESPTPQNQTQTAKNSSGNFPPANSGSSSIPSIASRAPVYAPMGSFNKPDRSAQRNATASGRNSYGQTSRNSSQTRAGLPSVAPIGSRTPLYDASESWDEPESAAPQNHSLPAQNSSGNLPPANPGQPSVSPIASHNPVYAPIGGFNNSDRSAPRNRTSSGQNSYGQTCRNTSWGRAEPPSVAPIGSRTPLYDASESWDDEPESAAPKNLSNSVQNSSQSLPQSNSDDSKVPPIASRTPLYAPSESWDPEPAVPHNLAPPAQNTSRQPFGRIPRINSSSSSGMPTRNHAPVYAPTRNRDNSGSSVPRNEGRSGRNFTGQSYNDRQTGSRPSSARPFGNRAPRKNWQPPAPRSTTPSAQNTSHSTNSVAPNIPINANRSPLYDPSESWD